MANTPNPERRASIRRCFNAGITIKEICESMGLSRSGVRHYLENGGRRDVGLPGTGARTRRKTPTETVNTAIKYVTMIGGVGGSMSCYHQPVSLARVTLVDGPYVERMAA